MIKIAYICHPISGDVKRGEAWEYPDFLLVTLCEKCHKEEHETGLIGRINYWINKNFKL